MLLAVVDAEQDLEHVGEPGRRGAAEVEHLVLGADDVDPALAGRAAAIAEWPDRPLPRLSSAGLNGGPFGRSALPTPSQIGLPWWDPVGRGGRRS